MSEPLRVALLIGSTRPHRFADTVVRWVVGRIEHRHDIVLDVVDLAKAELPFVLPSGENDAVTAFGRRMAAADGIVVVTPEYNHGFPAPLKQAIDLLHGEWQAKPVAFVSYGGISGGLRAVEQLRVVIAELHAVTLRDTVSFHGARAAFDDRGQPHDPQRKEAALNRLMAQLLWWGYSLRSARRALPYPG